jgi:hypothetical protein
MANQQQHSFWRFDEQLRVLQANAALDENSKWGVAAHNLAAFSNLSLSEQPKSKSTSSDKLDTARRNYSDKPTTARGKLKQKADKYNVNSADWKLSGDAGNSIKNKNNNNNTKLGVYNASSNGIHSTDKNTNNNNNNNNNSLDKRFKTLPPSESLPRNETLGGYIFVCNNDTMQDDLKRQLFGLPQRYRDSVRAITPGLPLFLYNYTTHQLHGIFEAASFGGTNIDPTAWEDKKCQGESRFPAQVRIRTRKLCKALEEDAFRPVLHHYDGPKFRLQLNVPETLALMDICNENGPP